MALADSVITLAGLCEMELPSRTIRLCDGAFVDWPERGMFVAEDPEFGTIAAVGAVAEAVGDEAPSGTLTMLPPSVADAIDLFQPDAQGGAMRFWLAEVDQSSGTLAGEPELQFAGMIDTIKLNVARSQRTVEITFMSEAERLFWTREGNVLSPRFHKMAWPGETGFDQATGAVTAIPWGVAGPPRGSISGGTGASRPTAYDGFRAIFG